MMNAVDQLKILHEMPGSTPFRAAIERPIHAGSVDILQINVGRRCNLMCKHCHVEAGPHRTEVMSRGIFELCLDALKRYPIGTIDITGGSPEMNPELPWFIDEAAKLDRRLMVRSNLVILLEEPYRRFIDIYAENGVEIVTSLPDYHAERVDRQRGANTYRRVIEAMHLLNGRGYGKPGSGLILDLVSNPVGAYLPGSQEALEHEYRTRLEREHGVTFNTLFCLTNCPVGRYLEYLVASTNYQDYMTSLVNAFNCAAVEDVMCRTTVSVGWDGTLYDCDFNQMLGLPIGHGAPDHIRDFDFERLKTRRIIVDNHCFSCTAGAGSSCQGALDG